MIVQYCLKLDTALPAGAGYPMYAALLEQAPAEFAWWVHERGVTPISQYVAGDRWYVSLLGQRSREALCPVLETLETLPLRKLDRRLRITGRQERAVRSVEELLSSGLPDSVAFQLLTPTAFKSGGAYQLLPTQRLLLQSLLLKWNGCFGEECPIEDEGEGLEALAAGLVYRSVRLSSVDYPMKRAVIPGTVGTIRVENRLTGFHRELMDGLLTFGAYSGIGIKTALGMGGFQIQTGS